jgi:hypothetical protein
VAFEPFQKGLSFETVPPSSHDGLFHELKRERACEFRWNRGGHLLAIDFGTCAINKEPGSFVIRCRDTESYIFFQSLIEVISKGWTGIVFLVLPELGEPSAIWQKYLGCVRGFLLCESHSPKLLLVGIVSLNRNEAFASLRAVMVEVSRHKHKWGL